MLRTLTWLTNKAVDEVTEEPEAYDEVRQKLIDVLVYEEERIGKFKGYQLSTILKESWAIGASWYSLALASHTGLFFDGG